MVMENEILAYKILDKMLDSMDEENKNKLIKLLIMHDAKDILINQIPIYGELRHNGYLIAKYIKEFKYTVGLKHDAADLDTEPHEVEITI